MPGGLWENGQRPWRHTRVRCGPNPRERGAYLELIDYHLQMGDEIGAEGILKRAVTHLPRDAVRLRHVFGLARDRYRKGRGTEGQTDGADR